MKAIYSTDKVRKRRRRIGEMSQEIARFKRSLTTWEKVQFQVKFS